MLQCCLTLTLKVYFLSTIDLFVFLKLLHLHLFSSISAYNERKLSIKTTSFRSRQAKMCLRACATCTDSGHPAQAQSIIRIFIHHVVSNNSVGGRRRSWSDCGCLHVPEDTFSRPIHTQQSHSAAGTSLQRRCNVTTLQLRCNDVVATFYISWDRCTCTTPPSGHTTFIQRRLNVDATSWRCIDVETTLYKCRVSDGFIFDSGRYVATEIKRAAVSSGNVYSPIRSPDAASTRFSLFTLESGKMEGLPEFWIKEVFVLWLDVKFKT